MSRPQNRTANNVETTLRIRPLGRAPVQHRHPTARQRRYVHNVLCGQSKRAAAMNAGYSAATAHNAAINIESKPAVRQLFITYLDRAGVTPELLARRMREGLDAVIEVRTKSGQVFRMPAWGERRHMVELALDVLGLLRRPTKRSKQPERPLEELLTRAATKETQ
jgi:hypothetical protein